MKPVMCVHCKKLIEESCVVETHAFLKKNVLVLIACPHCRKLDMHKISRLDYQGDGLVRIKSATEEKPIFASLCAHMHPKTYRDKK